MGELSDRLYEKPFESLRSTHAEVKRTYYKLKAEMSRTDKQISELYHELEKVDLNEDIGYQYSIALQNLLRRRRVIKDEFIPIDIMFQSLSESIESLKERIGRNREKSEEIRASLNVQLRIAEFLNV
ncbi:hypothetical protein [Lederbergia citri]|uniref:Uncharacterized protein n=1 Tax=Lederbergia citri TaxID=2833580 RepID=A0A942T966_9BACI|nr:hypothetical protein [Lederbergia citri]MBS4193478.1 hypothetical protein [Lederbergia citri]